MIRQTNYSRLDCVVLDVDTQRCFFSDRGQARVLDGATVLANIRRVMAWTRLEHIGVISTKQVPVCYCDFQRGNTKGLEKIDWTLRDKRTQFDATDCTDLPNAILEQYDQIIFCKRSIDPFEEPRIDRMLTELEADEFILIGSLVESAIRATALGLLARRKNVSVLVDAVGSSNKRVAKLALRSMWARGAKLTDTPTLLRSYSPHSARTQPYHRTVSIHLGEADPDPPAVIQYGRPSNIER